MTAPAPAFYVTGGALHAEAASYVVRHADATLYSALIQGEFCYVLTARQMGKSSLMARTAHRLRAAGVAVAVLDLTELGYELTREQWYVGLLARLGEQLDPDDAPKLDDALAEFWELHGPQLGPVACWFAALREVVLPYFLGPVVLFVDEVDYVRSLPFATDEFFAMIRACYDRRAVTPRFTRLTFCLLGVVTPTELIQDPARTPFNIGRRIELTDFTPTEAAPLATGLGCAPRTGAVLVRRMLAWTGGHPYLTQRLCQAVADAGNVRTPAGVDRVCQAVFLTAQAQEQDSNLPEVRKCLLRDDVDQARLLTLYAQVRRGKRLQANAEDPLLSALSLAGLTRVAHGRLRVRNRIYARVFDRAWLRTHLPGAERRRQRMAFWRKVAATAAAALLLVGSGVWYWDAYQRPHVAYYTTVITRNGLPEGIGRLTDEQVGHRNSSLAFHQYGRRGLVHEIRVVNSRGASPPVAMDTNLFALGSLNPLPQERIDAVPEALAVSRVAFERDARGHILNQIAYNRAGRPLYTLHYVLPDQAEYKDEAITRAVSESGISLLKFVRAASGPEAGRTKEVRFFDSAGKPQPSRHDIYGVQYGLDAGGLPVEQIYLGAEGQPAVTKEGIAKATWTYDALGNPTQVAFVGRDGQAVVTKEGVAGMQLAYDAYGNLQEVVFVGTDGQLAIMRDIGAAGRSFRYDAHGNVVETTFFDAHRHLVTGGRGAQQGVASARRTLEWDAHGRSLETYFDPDGNPIVVGGRVVKTRVVWDPRGYLMEASFFDEHERPICDPKGCAKRRITRDTHGNVAEESCLDEMDHPIRSTEGYAFFKQVHDDRGNVIAESYFGPTGQPELYDEHHVKMRFTYNAQGKHVAAAFFDATEQPIKNKEGYAKVTFSYNLHGNLTEVAFFDEQDQPIMRKGGAARLRRTYNAHDQLIAETLYDQHGHPTRDEDGYVTQRLVYDARGYRIETAHFDEDDHPTVSTDGYAKEQIKYNDHGQVEEVALVGLDGGYALHTKYGFAKVRRTYNERGQDAQWTYVDAQDRLVQLTNGYAIIRYTYDALGRKTTRLFFFDVHGVPVHTRVAITKVEPDRVSQRLGLQVGDILVSYDGEDLWDTRIFREWELVKGERRRELRLQRQGQDVRLEVPPGRLTGLTVEDRVPPPLTEADP